MSERVNEAGEGKNLAEGDCTTPPSSEQTQADLKKDLDFALKKLQIVGSVTRHDVLNQLTAIVGYNELLGMMVEDVKQRSFIEKEKQAIDKIRRQFKFAKDYQNIGVESARWQMLKNVIHRACEEVDLKAIRIHDMTEGASVCADPLFEKVFSNLFENTLLYGGTASEIRISLLRNDTGAVLVVEDNGTGIPYDEKTKVFEHGYGNGTGWGLFLAREILAVTGMTITETGEPGKGTRFEILIPEGMYRPEGGEPQAP